MLLTAISNENSTAAVESGEVRERIADINPIDLFAADVLPTILVHGDADNAIPYENSLNLLVKLEDNGVPAELITYEGQGRFIRSVPRGDESHPAGADARMGGKEFIISDKRGRSRDGSSLLLPTYYK